MTTSISIFVASLLVASSASHASNFWQNYQDTRISGSDLRDPSSQIHDDKILSNYSYAGYQFANAPIPDVADLGYKVFEVTRYGAQANDSVSDKAAMRDTIAAAEQYIDAGGTGAIIKFSTGTFHINDSSDVSNIDGSDTSTGVRSRKSATIKLSRSNMILQGSGRDTVLYMDQHLDLIYPTKMWTSPYMIEAGYNYDNRDPNVKGVPQPYTSPTGDKFIALVKSSHLRSSTRTISVNDSRNLKVGQWVMLTRLDNRQATIDGAVSPYKADSSWKKINKGLRSQEYHQIFSIQNDLITFDAVIHHDIAADGYWGLKKTQFIKHIGIENLTIKGNWHTDFKHHASGIHDGGWSALRLSNVANAWVRNVQFENLNQGLSIVNGAASTLENLTFSGTPGHMSLDINASTHILASNINDTAQHWHAAGFSHRAVGNVIKDAYHAPNRFHNLHSDMPYANLIENNVGGWNYGFMGGAVSSQPNHLKHLVFWNVTNTSDNKQPEKWAFMRHDSKYGRVIMPYVVGMKSPSFSEFESQQTYDRSLPDTPQAFVQSTATVHSLYESQLLQRHCAPHVIAENLIGYWTLKNRLCDQSGHDQEAQLVGEHIGRFNGVGERIELGDFDSLSRIELDFKYDSWNPNKTGFMISKDNYGTKNPYYIQVNKQGVLSARVNGSGVNAKNYGDGQWHTLVMHLDGNKLSLSIDGILIGYKEVTVPPSNNVPLSVGSTPKNTYPFIGEVANIKIYK
ncbi:hypothetical protein BGP78_00420 [Pseudoalteromonas sp. MSK9-3]|uniref:DUF4955 domain-containing protein n=1 Tax=Pseudoalteromonas sp. MSK9-3 TaxID=1897633 RepID=UPI000E6C3397|nr:DUF4955 domain-containing protein [Pseudoalteromonas sp. MSK9-3]RJE77505.1 hypothetical protein BGP78_00420 [Pseudoalteromonas sp. MSK9-3]